MWALRGSPNSAPLKLPLTSLDLLWNAIGDVGAASLAPSLALMTQDPTWAEQTKSKATTELGGTVVVITCWKKRWTDL